MIADRQYEWLDNTYEGKEIQMVSFEDNVNYVVGPPLILVDLESSKVIGYIPGE